MRLTRSRRGRGRQDGECRAAQTSVGVAIDLARDQLGEQLRRADRDEVKALALLAVDAAGVASLFGNRGHHWWVPAAAYALAALLLLYVLRRQDYPTGPDPRELYFRGAPLEAVLALVEARDEVARLRRRFPRRAAYQAAIVLFLVATLGRAMEPYALR
jgi:hypothetical protein